MTKKHPHHHKLSLGLQVADTVAGVVGSWKFIIVQSFLLAGWITLNSMDFWPYKWDAPPYILLNLFLSFQAAYTAPFIMMSQNRQSEIDRLKAEYNTEITVKAEGEVAALHQKIDLLKEQEIMELLAILKNLVLANDNLATTAQ